MKLIVAGPRDYKNEKLVHAYLDLNLLELRHSKKNIDVLVHGCADGVDSFAKEWAEVNGIPTDDTPADWATYGKRAGPFRNAIMAQKGDELIAFTRGYTPGTYNMIQEMKKVRKPVLIVPDTTQLSDILRAIEGMKNGCS